MQTARAPTQRLAFPTGTPSQLTQSKPTQHTFFTKPQLRRSCPRTTWTEKFNGFWLGVRGWLHVGSAIVALSPYHFPYFPLFLSVFLSRRTCVLECRGTRCRQETSVAQFLEIICYSAEDQLEGADERRSQVLQKSVHHQLLGEDMLCSFTVQVPAQLVY